MHTNANFAWKLTDYAKWDYYNKLNQSEWAETTFIVSKKDKTVYFILDFRELNKQIKQRLYPIPKIQDLLLKLKGFQNATSLDLSMVYYNIELTEIPRYSAPSSYPGANMNINLPIGLCNSPDIFQEK